jgi:hypothetical protein
MTKIVNGDEEIVREMTEQEYVDFLANQEYWEQQAQAKAEALAASEAAKAAAEAKLEALGLTTDDLKALGLGGN